MRRTRFVPVAVVATLALGACGGDKAKDAKGKDAAAEPAKTAAAEPAADAKKDDAAAAGTKIAFEKIDLAPLLELVPVDSSFVFGANLAFAMSGDFAGPDGKPLTESIPDPAARRTLEALKTCGVDVKGAVVGVEGAEDKPGFAAVISGKGVGVKSNLECLQKQAKAEGAKDADEWSFGEHKGKTVLKNASEEDMLVFVASEERLIATNTKWADKVIERIDGGGEGVATGALKPTIARAGTSNPVWIAALVPADMAKDVPPPGDKVRDFAGSLDTTDGMAIALSATTADEAAATAIKTQLTALLEQNKPMAIGFGVPEPAVKSIKIESEATALRASMQFTVADLAALRARLQQMQGMGAPGGAPMAAGGMKAPGAAPGGAAPEGAPAGAAPAPAPAPTK